MLSLESGSAWELVGSVGEEETSFIRDLEYIARNVPKENGKSKGLYVEQATLYKEKQFPPETTDVTTLTTDKCLKEASSELRFYTRRSPPTVRDSGEFVAVSKVDFITNARADITVKEANSLLTTPHIRVTDSALSQSRLLLTGAEEYFKKLRCEASNPDFKRKTDLFKWAKSEFDALAQKLLKTWHIELLYVIEEQVPVVFKSVQVFEAKPFTVTRNFTTMSSETEVTDYLSEQAKGLKSPKFRIASATWRGFTLTFDRDIDGEPPLKLYEIMRLANDLRNHQRPRKQFRKELRLGYELVNCAAEEASRCTVRDDIFGIQVSEDPIPAKRNMGSRCTQKRGIYFPENCGFYQPPPTADKIELNRFLQKETGSSRTFEETTTPQNNAPQMKVRTTKKRKIWETPDEVVEEGEVKRRPNSTQGSIESDFAEAWGEV